MFAAITITITKATVIGAIVVIGGITQWVWMFRMGRKVKLHERILKSQFGNSQLWREN